MIYNLKWFVTSLVCRPGVVQQQTRRRAGDGADEELNLMRTTHDHIIWSIHTPIDLQPDPYPE